MRPAKLLLLGSLLGGCVLAPTSSEMPGGTEPIPPTPLAQAYQSPSSTSRSAPQEATPPAQQTASRLPVTSLKLTGRLVFFAYTAAGDVTPSLVQMDLSTGNLTTIFRPPEKGWMNGAAISPDAGQIMLAYSPPPEAGQPEYGPTELFELPASGSSQPRRVTRRITQNEAFYQPVWSPDGKYVYYTHFTYKSAGDTQGLADYRIERVLLPGVRPQVIVDRAIWPHLSPDGTRLVYVAFDPDRQINDLYLAQADGKNPIALVPHGTFLSVDAPFFSPDSKSVVFSATGPGPAESLSLLDRLFGIQVALANGSPSDWWRVSAGGGPPVRLTAVFQSGLN
jgi:hypothetical protein